MRVKIVLMATLLLAFSTLPGCDSLGENPGLKFLADYQKNTDGTITFTLTLRNEGSRSLELVSTTSQIYDLEIYREPGVLVWNWAHDLSFATVITTVTLQPGEQKTYQVTWNIRSNQGDPVPPGTYGARARLVTDPSASYKFEIKI
ncbi:MAG: BsuPI-related putative proteinase inhibitor [Candidatus Saccharicenans sp.]|nr:BsuPI-related putative proteinase inhibitor [Candidatus Saccharicenans sp.]